MHLHTWTAKSLRSRRGTSWNSSVSALSEGKFKATGDLNAALVNAADSQIELKNADIGQLNLRRVNVTLEGPANIAAMSLRDVELTVVDTEEPISFFPTSLNDVTLSLAIDGTEWDSPITVQEATRGPRLRGATLEISLADKADVASLPGTELKLFDWSQEPSNDFRAINAAARLEIETSQLYTNGTIEIISIAMQPELAGDFDGDAQFTEADLEELYDRIRVGSSDAYYDVNGDNVVSTIDLLTWVTDFRETLPGDANLDGVVESTTSLLSLPLSVHPVVGKMATLLPMET